MGRPKKNPDDKAGVAKTVRFTPEQWSRFERARIARRCASSSELVLFWLDNDETGRGALRVVPAGPELQAELRGAIESVLRRDPGKWTAAGVAMHAELEDWHPSVVGAAIDEGVRAGWLRRNEQSGGALALAAEVDPPSARPSGVRAVAPDAAPRSAPKPEEVGSSPCEACGSGALLGNVLCDDCNALEFAIGECLDEDGNPCGVAELAERMLVKETHIRAVAEASSSLVVRVGASGEEVRLARWPDPAVDEAVFLNAREKGTVEEIAKRASLKFFQVGPACDRLFGRGLLSKDIADRYQSLSKADGTPRFVPKPQEGFVPGPGAPRDSVRALRRLVARLLADQAGEIVPDEDLERAVARALGQDGLATAQRENLGEALKALDAGRKAFREGQGWRGARAQVATAEERTLDLFATGAAPARRGAQATAKKGSTSGSRGAQATAKKGSTSRSRGAQATAKKGSTGRSRGAQATAKKGRKARKIHG